MKKIALILTIVFVSFASVYATGEKESPIKSDSEYLFQELTDEYGNTIFRKYKKDCYIDIVITPEGHADGRVYFYNPSEVASCQVSFGKSYEEEVVLSIPDASEDLENGKTYFGMMLADELNKIDGNFTMMLDWTDIYGEDHFNVLTLNQ